MRFLFLCSSGDYSPFKAVLRYLLSWGLSFGAVLAAPVLSAAETTDLRIRDVYRAAYPRNPKIVGQAANIRSAEANLRLAYAQWLPALNAAADYTRQENDANLLSPSFAFTSHTTSLVLSQKVWDVPSWYQQKIARIQKNVEQTKLDAMGQQVLRESIFAYFEVTESQAALHLVEQEALAAKRQWEQAQARFSVGIGAKTDAEEAKSIWDMQQANVLLAQHKLDTALQHLALMTGDTRLLPEQFPLLKPTSTSWQALQCTWEKTLAVAVARNPDLQAALDQTQQAVWEQTAKQTAYWPTVKFQASASQSRTQGSDPDKRNPVSYVTRQHSAVWSGSLELFQGGKTRFETAAASARVQQKQAEYEAIERDWQEKYAQARIGWESARVQIQALHQAIHSAKLAVDATEAGALAGTRTRLDVLQQIAKWYGQQRLLLGTQLEALRHWVLLRQSVGLLQPEDLLVLDAQFAGKALEQRVKTA